MLVLAGCSGDTEQAATSSLPSTPPSATSSSAAAPSTTPSPTSEASSASSEQPSSTSTSSSTTSSSTSSSTPSTPSSSSTTRTRTATATRTEREDEPEEESQTATPTRRETPRGRIVKINDYCDDTPWAVARTADGRTAYCVQVYATDAYVWSLRRAVRPVDPNVSDRDPRLTGPEAGEPCGWEGIPGYDVDGRRYMCVGEEGGSGVWRRAD